MFVWTIQDFIGLVIFALFMCLALLVWLLILFRKFRSWLRRRWARFTFPWSHRNA